jgi:diguanylate cyclase (GGDEF)-like protein
MIAQGNTLGTLHLEFDRASEQHGDSSSKNVREGREQLAVSAASHIALSLASLQLRETLREQSIRDPLTRLFNRRFLEESLERELQLAARKHQSLTVLFLDLDHFKTFNDTFGHEAGDSVLQSLAQVFCSFFRTTDICCRYGGEEFAIILPESSAGDAFIRAEALRDEVKKLRLQYMKRPLGPVSISVGVATFPDHATSSSQLLATADRCLYESKTRGRDRVTVATAQPAYTPSSRDPSES